MSTVQEIINEVLDFPIEKRTYIADSILKSINQPKDDIDKKWIVVAQRRLEELKTGETIGIPGEEVFAEISKRFSS